jgi:hypothetical protein
MVAAVAQGAPSAFADIATTTSLTRTTETSAWTPPSSDPMGITYVPWTDRLLVVDAEVDEIPSFTGKNLFEVRRDGTVAREGSTTAYSNEPTDITVDPETHTYFIADDDRDRVFVVKDGPDNKIGTEDDPVTAINTRAWGNNDVEGLTFGQGDLFLSDGIKDTVFRLSPGPNGVFDGVVAGDDHVVSSWDVGAAGQIDAEGIDYYAGHDTIAVISDFRKSPISEFTLDGQFIRTIDVSAADVRHASGLQIAPSSGDPADLAAYITDRGVDNNFDPNENDGRLYELALIETPNAAPQVTNPGDRSTPTGSSVTLQIHASDADGETLTYSATGLPGGVSIDSATGLISGTVGPNAAAGSPFATDVAVTDGFETSHALFSWSVTDGIAPAAPTGLKIAPSSRGLALDWANSPEPDVTGYVVSRASSAGGSYTNVTASPMPASTYLDTGAAVDDESFYRVSAVDAAGNVSAPVQGSAHRGIITFRGATRAHARVASLNVALPAGAAPGDVLVATVTARGSAPIGLPAGWILAKTTAVSGSLRSSLAYRVVGASEPASSTFNLSTVRTASAVMVAYRGVDTAWVVDGASARATAATSIKIVAPGFTTTTAGDLLVGSFAIANASKLTPPAGMTQAGQVAHKVGTTKVAVLVADATKAVPGATGKRVGKAGAAASNIGELLALRPAAP